MLLIFGPNEKYYFDDGNGNRRWRAWPAFDKHMASKDFGKINAMAFGENETFWISYTVAGLHRNDWEDPTDRYIKLENWMFHEGLPHNYGEMSVCLGPGGSFFASSSQGHRWKDLPDGCIEYYQKFTRPDLFMTKRVSQIDIGHNNAYLGIGIDGTWFWNLEKEYPVLSNLLGQKGVTNVTGMYLNPFASNQHLVKYSDNTVHWSLPPSWISDMQSLFQSYAAQTGACVPQSPPPLPHRKSSGSRWKPSWAASSSSQAHAGVSPTTSSPHSPPPVNPFMVQAGYHAGNNPLTTVPLATQNVPRPNNNFHGTQPAPQSGPHAGAGVDWNQAMGLTQSALDAYNNAQGGGGGGGNLSNGLQIANSLANNGLMIGQLAGQVGGVAAACVLM